MRAGHIRDDVHGDIPLSWLESRVVDDALFQRLRGVRQSAAAHLVFPTMRVTRFEHSIGVMHAASLFFRHSLVNTDVDLRRQLLDDISNLVEGLESFQPAHAREGHPAPELTQLEQVVRERDVNHGLIAAFDIAARTPGTAAEQTRWLCALAVCEQGLRLCALLHDLGHLPYSHDFELAVVAAWAEVETQEGERGDNAAWHRLAPLDDFVHLHESVSLGLSSVLRHRVAGALSTDGAHRDLFCEVAFALARSLLRAKRRASITRLEGEQGDGADLVDAQAGISKWLYSLLDGELDADRADYVLRDSAGYTLGSAAYDLSRLLEAIGVARVDGQPTTVVRRAGVGAVEGFFLARYRLYADAIYHHRIQQATAGLRYAIQTAMSMPSPTMDEFMDAVATLASLGDDSGDSPLSRADPEVRANVLAAAKLFEDFDDSRMGSVLDELVAGVGGDVAPAWHCFRNRGRDVVTVWKRATEVPVAATEIRDWRRTVRARAISNTVRASLQRQGILLGFAAAKSWKSSDGATSQLLVSLGANGKDAPGLEPLSDHAPLFAAIKSAADEQVEVFAYQLRGDAPALEGPAIAQALLEDARKSGDAG